MLKVIELLQRDELFPKYKDLVRTKERDGLLLLNYSQLCQYANVWDEVTTACRGLIVDTGNWSTVARPFDKFFNLGEHPSVKRENLPDEPFMVFEKVDGSMGSMYRDRRGDPWIATRGGFDGPQALRGTEMLRTLRLDVLPDGYTPIFEIVYPNQHVAAENSQIAFSVIKYDYEGLVLLGLRHRDTGAELPWDETADLAGRLGTRLPKVHAYSSFDEAYADAKSLPQDQEGFVLRFKNGLRVKMKGTAYLALNALVWDITDKRILDALVEGTYEKLVVDLPEEFRAVAERFAAGFAASVDALRAEAEAGLREAPRGDRKLFSAWVEQNVRPELRGAVYFLHDGKTPRWYKLLRNLA